ncbi:MAG: hypothetical protein PVH72_04770, partial [Desulfobacterales bacterium]
MNKTRVVQIGLGPLGQKIAQFIAQRKSLEVIGAVDVSPEIIDRDIGELCGLDNMGIKIQSSIGECLRTAKPDAVILTTVSTMEKITPQIEEIVSYGIPVVSTCEELSYPWDASLSLSERIDKAAKTNQVAVLGTGVNPGFLMDSLPTFLTSVCQDVQRITVHRIQNAAFRRIPFQKKIGAGLTLEQFENKKKEGILRHVGLTESVQLIASRMGWELNKTEDILVPVIADREIITDTMRIPVGYATGVQQIGKGYVGNEDKIILVFRASIGEPNPQDSIEIKGTPTI